MGESHFPSTKIETKCVSKLHREWTRDRFFARLHHSTRELRACDSSRGRRCRVCLHTDGFRPVRIWTLKRFHEKRKKKPRAQFSDSASLTLNVLKYVVAFFGPFWRNPRVNIFLVPCLRPLLRARWLPMMQKSSSSPFRCVERKKEEEEAQVFSFFFKDEVFGLSVQSVFVCVFGRQRRKDFKNKKKDDTTKMSFFFWWWSAT